MFVLPAVPFPPRAARVALLAFATVLGACDRSTPVESTSALRARASNADVGIPSGAPGATGPAFALENAWNAGDAAGIAATYAEDAEVINPIGAFLFGRPAIQTAHAFLLSVPFKGSHRATEVRRVTYLTGTMAVVDLNVRLTGFVGLPPGLHATSPGLILTRERQIVVKRGGEWEIVMTQITAVAPAP